MNQHRTQWPVEAMHLGLNSEVEKVVDTVRALRNAQAQVVSTWERVNGKYPYLADESPTRYALMRMYLKRTNASLEDLVLVTTMTNELLQGIYRP